MACIASLEGHFPPPDWTFGGGTALMLLYEHRRSKDIDIFLRDPQYLTALSPRLNDHTEALTGRYVEQSNFLKLIFDGGEVDFIVAPSLTTDPYMIKTVLGTETGSKHPWRWWRQRSSIPIVYRISVLEQRKGLNWIAHPLAPSRWEGE